MCGLNFATTLKFESEGLSVGRELSGGVIKVGTEVISINKELEVISELSGVEIL